MTYQRSTTYVPKTTNHTFHLLLTLFTCGMWAPVWALVAIINMVSKDKHTTVNSGGWYGPVARPYEVGPGAPVSATNPHPPTPAVPMPPMPPYVGYGPGYPSSAMRPPPLPARIPHYDDVAAEPPLHDDQEYSTDDPTTQPPPSAQ